MAKICCGGFNLGDGLELDGKTLKTTGGSGKGTMIVTVTQVGEEEWVADKTLEELLEAAPNVICNITIEETDMFLPLQMKSISEDFKIVGFSCFDCSDEGVLTRFRVDIDSTYGVTVYQKDFEVTPIESDPVG